ncbi:glycosyltransferase [uncultured Dokdonia sp.]|uniref:glycosyltransferase family 2 protein n=1 Tax=uncultured Dokdonia sp. TaxID=575653 RepID=UPI00261ABA90|nr:glycosyltransferase [uncultured Dokdonia sp.]
MVLSVIIPVYNTEKFIKKCILSILDFCDNSMDIEVIAVNDGSTDTSLKELQAIQDTRLIVINQDNAGVSAARNRGLDEAKGSYVWLIDADDYLSDHFIGEVYNILTKTAPELLLFGINWVDKDTLLGQRIYAPGEYTVSQIIEARIYDSNVWSRVIKRDLIENHHIRFIDVMNGEDFDFCIKVFCHAQKVTIPKIIGYNYLTNPNGSSKKRAQTHLKNLAIDSVKTLVYLKAFFEKSRGTLHNEFEVFKPWFNNNIFGLLFSLYRFDYNISFAKNIIHSLAKNGYYPVETTGQGRKQKIFISIANRKSLFISILKLRRFLNI